MIVVADLNTVWRSRPFEALSQLTPVLGLRPIDPWAALKERQRPWGATASPNGAMKCLKVVLRFGWATSNATGALTSLWKTTETLLADCGSAASALVVTTPHYAPLAENVARKIPVFYYCSDLYSAYDGWDPVHMEQMEHRIFEVATRSIFVSAALRDRAVSRHAVPVHKTSVSMNAAEPVLDVPANGAGIPSTSSFLNWKRPVVGITGKITHRIDLGLIKKVAGLPEVGCVILIGGVSASVRRTDDFQAIVRSGKCIHLGERPQAELRIWHQLFDLALIPYVSSEFNYCCSPMRLFDYLAAQKEIVATDACAQVLEFRDVVDVAHDTSSFLELVSHRLRLGPDLNRLKTLRKLAEGNTWSSRAKELVKILNPC